MSVVLEKIPKVFYLISPLVDIQMGLELETPKDVKKALDFFSSMVPALHLQLRDKNQLVYNYGNDAIIKHHLPKFKTTREACLYSARKHNINPFDRFGSISFNDHQLVINISHSFSDGGYLRFLLTHFLNNDIPKELPISPLDFFDTFKEQIASAPPCQSLFFNKHITRIYKTDKFTPDKDDLGIVPFVLKSTEFKMLNKTKTGPRNFTESNWLSMYLGACLYFDKILPNYGIATHHDLRKYFTRPQTFLDCYNTSSLVPHCNVDPDMPLEEMGYLLRKDFEMRRAKKQYFGHFKAKTNIANISLDHVRIDCSPVGRIKIKKPIKDVWMSVKTTDRATSLLSFSVDNGKENIFHINYRYPPKVISKKQARKWGKSIEYFMKNISHNRTVKEAFNELKEFNQSL